MVSSASDSSRQPPEAEQTGLQANGAVPGDAAEAYRDAQRGRRPKKPNYRVC